MKMIRFNCDYGEGAHPRVLQKLADTNFEQTPGYGEDEYCAQAAELIRKECKREDVAVHFIVGGTQTNLIVIAAALRTHQGVISAASGHINVHETGSIEATGHKVISLPDDGGKITAQQIEKYYLDHIHDESFEHIVQPKMVYISNPTEYGTVYNRNELVSISNVCRQYGLYLYMDGARMGYGLCAEGNDLNLPFITECCDVFYIGGTKVGALFGEAVVIKNEELKKDFRYIIKQRGAMLAKGRLLGLQFLALFEDGLYYEISAHADQLAEKIKKAFLDEGYSPLFPSSTNQQFFILPNSLLGKLKEKYSFATWGKFDDTQSIVRFCTSWATKEESVSDLVADIHAYAQ
jgi:threonine aldolase